MNTDTKLFYCEFCGDTADIFITIGNSRHSIQYDADTGKDLKPFKHPSELLCETGRCVEICNPCFRRLEFMKCEECEEWYNSDIDFCNCIL